MHPRITRFLKENNLGDQSDAPSAEWAVKVCYELISHAMPFLEEPPRNCPIAEWFVYIYRGFRLIQINVTLNNFLKPTKTGLAEILDKMGAFMQWSEHEIGEVTDEVQALLAETSKARTSTAEYDREIERLEAKAAANRRDYEAERRQIDELIDETTRKHADCVAKVAQKEMLEAELAKQAAQTEQLEASIKRRQGAIRRLEPLVRAVNDGISLEDRVAELRAELDTLAKEHARLNMSCKMQKQQQKEDADASELYLPVLRDLLKKSLAGRAKLEATQMMATRGELELKSQEREVAELQVNNQHLREKLQGLASRLDRVKRQTHEFEAEQATRFDQLDGQKASLAAMIASDRHELADQQRRLSNAVERKRHATEMLATQPALLAGVIAQLDEALEEMRN